MEPACRGLGNRKPREAEKPHTPPLPTRDDPASGEQLLLGPQGGNAGLHGQQEVMFAGSLGRH